MSSCNKNKNNLKSNNNKNNLRNNMKKHKSKIMSNNPYGRKLGKTFNENPKRLSDQERLSNQEQYNTRNLNSQSSKNNQPVNSLPVNSLPVNNFINQFILIFWAFKSLYEKEQIAEKIINKNYKEIEYHLQLKESVHKRVVKMNKTQKNEFYQTKYNNFQNLLNRYLHFIQFYSNKIVQNKLFELYSTYKKYMLYNYQLYHGEFLKSVFRTDNDTICELVYYYHEAVSNLHKILKFFTCETQKN